MEACATAHQWARELRKLGHDARLMPPTYVKAYVKRALSSGGPGGGSGISQPNMPDFSKWGTIEKLPLKGVRKATAEGMARN